ncbi:MAG: hypothetical protein JO019_01855 [Candidatus Kaiserbacteria bacterium]|nr:hypothetical protein [Candidatus Kaiserbacteria bacterium]
MEALLKKLQVKGENSLQVFNKPNGVKVSAVRGRGSRVVLEFAKHKKDLKAVASKHTDVLWVAYPKGSSNIETDLNRDVLRREMEKHGLKSVSLVAVDEAWSAMRFKRTDK